MGEIGNIFDNLYRQFILRDLFAKIAPGSIGLLFTFLVFLSSLQESLCTISGFRFWQWLIVFAVAWMAGFVLQHGGIVIGLLKDRTYSYRKKNQIEKIEEHFLAKALITIDAGLEYNKVLERIVVIKEACGNWSIALGYSAVMLLVRYFLHFSASCKYVLLYVFLFIGFVLGGFILNMAHRFHFDREGWFKDAYFDYKKERGNQN
ncbi:hypothetical protein IMZ48_48940 [Candidatus Bathyarchaeota archaeon]|nr:hypothetical protein [Candidatus Bathyarchaeota archaeon]